MFKKIVLDSCVFCKLFLQEPDRQQAINLMRLQLGHVILLNDWEKRLLTTHGKNYPNAFNKRNM